MKTRYGTLELQKRTDDVYYCSCLVHPRKALLRLTTLQIATGVRRCPACAVDSLKLHKSIKDMTGQTFGDYVAIKSIGLSTRAATVKQNQQQWRGKTKLQYNYCQHRYWLCYCRFCYKEREIRGDVLRSDKTPRCSCKIRK